eukprot:GSChrysophyteH1.ASY1.ANO1.318.1 assembled CDS
MQEIWVGRVIVKSENAKNVRRPIKINTILEFRDSPLLALGYSGFLGNHRLSVIPKSIIIIISSYYYIMSDFATVSDAQKLAAEQLAAARKLAAAHVIKHADAVLVCAGAGMSVKPNSGENVYVNEEDFAKQYPFFPKWGYRTSYETMGLRADTSVPLEAKWGLYVSHFNKLRYEWAPAESYELIKQLIGHRDYFVWTSNVDGNFLKAGFDEDKIYTPQGDGEFIQCRRPCSRDSVFPAKPMYDELLSGISKDGLIKKEDIPKCKNCGGEVFINVRGGSWFSHHNYDKSSKRIEEWIEEIASEKKKLAIIEVGAGYNTPVVTRLPMESIARTVKEAHLIRINPDQHEVPPDLSGSVGLPEGWQVLSTISDCIKNEPDEKLHQAREYLIQQQENRLTSLYQTHREDYDWKAMLQSLRR